MLIRHATPADKNAVWAIIGPTIRAGETYTLDRDLGKDAALRYWMDPEKETFVVDDAGELAGTYYIRPNQLGGGRHVCNCGFEIVGRLPGAFFHPTAGYVDALVMYMTL